MCVVRSRHFSISFYTAQVSIPLTVTFWKNKTWLTQLLCSIIWRQYYFSTIAHFCLNFLHPFGGIQWCSGRSMCLNVWSSHPLAFPKNIFNDCFGKLPKKTSILESLIQVHLQTFQVYERPLAVRGSPKKHAKENMPKKF